MRIGRRPFVLGLSLAGCTRCERGAVDPPAASEPAQAPVAHAVLAATEANVSREAGELPSPDGGPPPGRVKTETWSLAGDGRAFTIVPAWTKPDEELPMLLALHGRGEALKGPALGVMGWPQDYALLRAIERVSATPLTTEDFEGFVEPSRLGEHNAALAKRPFAGLVIVCPYSPDVDLRKTAQIQSYVDYVMNAVVPRAKAELPVLGTPASTGIDGVSLGGALALRIGLGNPEAFGAVGTLQPAIGADQVADFTALAKGARAKNPKLSLRLLTSQEDFFKRAIRSTSAAWRAAGIEHDFEELPGPHDYPFNRGPGAIEMLLWHDRVLARAAG